MALPGIGMDRSYRIDLEDVDMPLACAMTAAWHSTYFSTLTCIMAYNSIGYNNLQDKHKQTYMHVVHVYIHMYTCCSTSVFMHMYIYIYIYAALQPLIQICKTTCQKLGNDLEP